MASRPAAPRPQSPRPLSPHMSIWRWRVHAIVSILHRITGNIMAVGAVTLFLWWLVAAATGAEAYATFLSVATGWFGTLIGVGLTWVFFQHLSSGVRHLVMDAGGGYEIGVSRKSASATLIVSTLLTLVTWAVILSTKGL